MKKLNTKSKFLALAGLISLATLVVGPARLATAQVAAPLSQYLVLVSSISYLSGEVILQGRQVPQFVLTHALRPCKGRGVRCL